MITLNARTRCCLLICMVALAMTVQACSGSEAAPTPVPTGATSPVATPPPISLEAGRSAIKGVVDSGTGTLPQGVKVFLVPVYWNPQHTEAFYAVDASQAMSSSIFENGYFQLVNITPGDYVLVVGQSLEDAGIVTDARNQGRLFTTKPNETLDVGKQTVKLLAPH